MHRLSTLFPMLMRPCFWISCSEIKPCLCGPIGWSGPGDCMTLCSQRRSRCTLIQPERGDRPSSIVSLSEAATTGFRCNSRMPSRHLYFHLLWFRFLHLRHVDHQHAVFELRPDIVGGGVFR